MDAWTWITGVATLLSFGFAVYVYFTSKEYIYPLIEKLRASRNNFLHIQRITDRIVEAAVAKDIAPEEKVRQMRHLARTISQNTHIYMNTIDDGVDWGGLSTKTIYKGMKK